ncbi:MAG: Fibronectin type domain protein, partial [Ferruginibacter sp.]|nr:Fibronectin type domain protein [Ferruginibacter sp.]
PNWLSFSPAVSPARTFPKLSTILAGLFVTPQLPGGDAGANIEALSSVSRSLNFRLTVRDNHAYSSTAPVAVGQTAFTDVVVTVTNTSGPFQVTAPNTNVTWSAGSSATVTWSVNGTNAGSVSCANVNILLSTDGGNTFSTMLAASTPNDGSQVITVPSTQGATNRIKVEAVGNIFFDISNANFTIGTPPTCGNPGGLVTSAITQTAATVSWTAVSGAISYDVDYKAASSSTWINAASATTSVSVNLTGLTANTLYDWRVKATCAGGTGIYSQAQFTTTGTSSACPGTYDVSTNGTAAGAATIPLNNDVNGLMNVRGDDDYYKFTIATDGTITLSLTTLPADYQLALLNSGGTVLQSSTNSGTTSETINRTVVAGTYYARIYPRNNGAFDANNCYTLKVQAGTATRNAGTDVQYVRNQLRISPNPVGSTANLAFNAETSGNAAVSVISQTGSVVLTRMLAVDEGENIRKLNIGNLANGVYFIKVQKGSVIRMAKLVIIK